MSLICTSDIFQVWISPCTLIFENAYDIKFDIESSGGLDIGDVTRDNPALRGIGYLPQDGALFSTMTVEENLAFALRVRRVDKKRIVARVRDLAELMGIGQLLSRKPHGLSGGERQRVALGRALAFEPSILCLDEPLSALDSEMREQILQLLLTIKRMKGVTTLHVTHDLDEAARLADRNGWPGNSIISGRFSLGVRAETL